MTLYKCFRRFLGFAWTILYFLWLRVPGLYCINQKATIFSVARLAQLIITRCLRKYSVPGRGMVFISSYAQTGSGACPASHSIDISDSFLGIRCWGVNFTTHLPLVQRLRMGIRHQLPEERSAFILT